LAKGSLGRLAAAGISVGFARPRLDGQQHESTTSSRLAALSKSANIPCWLGITGNSTSILREARD